MERAFRGQLRQAMHERYLSLRLTRARPTGARGPVIERFRPKNGYCMRRMKREKPHDIRCIDHYAEKGEIC
jgi:hypothetical protein